MSNSKIKPLKIHNKLAQNPKSRPKYFQTIKNQKGEQIEVADPRATRALVAIMDQHVVHGGGAAHWGGPAAYAEVLASIHHIMFTTTKSWNDEYNFINDAGHAENGIYALRANYGFDNLSFKDLTKFRSMESKLTGHGEAHLNPEGVFCSNGPLGSGAAQAQGLAMADRLADNNRTTVLVISDGASMEGEAKEMYAALPGLAKKGLVNPFLMVISDNNTKLSGRIDKDSFSMREYLDSLEAQGWRVVRESEGNDLQKTYLAVEKSLTMAKGDATKPVCLLLKTVKGFGVKSTMEASSGGHGYPIKANDQKFFEFLSEIYANDKVPQELIDIAQELFKKAAPAKEIPLYEGVKEEKVQSGVAKAMINSAQKGLPVVSISSDVAGSTGVAAFQKEFPQMSIDVGIAESNMVGVAIGYSKLGFIPVVDTFAQFGVTKGNLPLTMAALSLGPVIGVFSHTGFQDAADGASHQATTYFAATAAIPHTQLVSLSCAKEAEVYVSHAIEYFADCHKKNKVPDNILFYLGRENYPTQFSNTNYEWGKAQLLQDGTDVALIATGPMVKNAILAARMLEAKGKKVAVINHAFINQFDVEGIAQMIKKAGGKAITIEDHQLTCGMGSILSHKLMMKGYQFKIRSIGIDGHFGQSAYIADHLYEHHKMDPASIAKTALELI